MLVAPPCSTLRDPMSCSPPGSSVHGILWARILEWVPILFSRGSSQPRDRTWDSCITADSLTSEPQGSPQELTCRATKTLAQESGAAQSSLPISAVPAIKKKKKCYLSCPHNECSHIIDECMHSYSTASKGDKQTVSY